MAEIKVYAPRKDFTGVVGGVAFTHGQATADSEKNAAALAYFRRAGYQVGEPQQEAPLAEDQDPIEDDAFEPEDEADEVEIPGMPKSDATRGQVAEFAEGMGIETEGLSKAKIIEAIKKEANNG